MLLLKVKDFPPIKLNIFEHMGDKVLLKCYTPYEETGLLPKDELDAVLKCACTYLADCPNQCCALCTKPDMNCSYKQPVSECKQISQKSRKERTS